MKLIVNNKNLSQVTEIAAENNLHVATIDGYHYVTDFRTLQEAKELADNYNDAEVCTLIKKNGKQWCFHTNDFIHGIDCMLHDNESVSCEIIKTQADFNEWKYDTMVDIYESNNIDRETYWNLNTKVAEAMKTLTDSQYIFVNYESNEIEVCEKHPTTYSHDVWDYKLAVMFGGMEQVTSLEAAAAYMNACPITPEEDLQEVCDGYCWEYIGETNHGGLFIDGAEDGKIVMGARNIVEVIK